MPTDRGRRLRRHLAGDDGFTLVEQLVTIVLLGIGVVAILGAILTLISTSTRHRDLSNATAVMATSAERVASAETPWVACALTTTYQPRAQVPASELPQDMATPNIEVTGVRFWDGADFVASCDPARTAQLVTISVSTGNAKDETIEVVKWNG